MASKNINFDTIPASIRKPGKYFEFNTKLAVRTLPSNAQKVLLIGQKTASGTATALTAEQIFSDSEARTKYGPGSMLYLMAKAAIKANPYLDLNCIALADAGAGVAADATVTITGPATSAGVLTVYVGDQKVEVAIADDDTATVIATALKAAITAAPDLPITADNTAGVLTATAKNKGTVGNEIPLAYVLANATGVTCTIVQMADGLTDPDIEDALEAVAAEQYHIIATPYANGTALVSLRDHLDLVSGPLEQRPGIGIYGQTGDLATVEALAADVNSGRILAAYLRYTTATIVRSLPCELAAAFAAVTAFEEDPARPLNTLELKGIAAPAISNRLSRTEQEALLRAGVTPHEVGPGNRVQIVRAVSTYVLDPQGIEDISLLDITTIRTLDYVRLACRTRIALRFPREKLSSKTPARVKTELLDVLYKLESLEIVEEVAANEAGLIVERDEQDPNRLDAKIPCDVVNGLHVFAGRIDLLL